MSAFFSEEVARLIAEHTKQSVANILLVLEQPPDQSFGDLAYPCFSLSKDYKKPPAKIAFELSQSIKPVMPIERVEAKGPYINFYFNKSLLSQAILSQKPVLPKRKTRVMIEHSNGNTHKSVHIGHLRNLFLGDSLVRITKKAGYPVVNCYYINDTGAMVAKCLWALLNKEVGDKPKEKKLQWLGEAYVLGSQELSDKPSIKKEVDHILQSLESQDKKILKLWKETRQWSIDDWHRIFDQVGMLPFDARFFDSKITPQVKAIVDEMKEKGILKESQGALIADLENYNLHTLILRKSDGTTPYIAKDLALAHKKFKDYSIDKSIYVVGSEQELHFQQLFKLLELAGFEQAKNCYHLSYGLVMLASGKMSSRDGTTVLFDDFYLELYDHAFNEVRKRHEDWKEKKQQVTAHKITLAAMKLPMIMQEPSKRIIFDIRQSLDFEGETGPYLQYSYARLNSVLRKYKKKVGSKIDYNLITSPEEQSLIKLIGQEPEVVLQAAQKYKPSLVARYAIELSQAINKFYHAQPVLSAEENTKKARLFLVLKAKECLQRTLEALGIPFLEEM